MFTARNIHYELSHKARSLGAAGIGTMHLLKEHKPYHGSDHVLSTACSLPAWNPGQHVFFRGVDALQQPLRC